MSRGPRAGQLPDRQLNNWGDGEKAGKGGREGHADHSVSPVAPTVFETSDHKVAF